MPVYVIYFNPSEEETAQKIVKEIIKADEQTSGSDSNEDDDNSHTWQITTKYYRATVRFVISSASDFSKISGRVEAVLFVAPQTAGQLSEWYSAAEMTSPPIDLTPTVTLVLEHGTDEDSSGSDPQTKQEILEWCLDHSAECVYLDQPSDEYNKEGVLRVAEALQMNQWSNAIMADRRRRCCSQLINSPTNKNNSNDCDDVIKTSKDTKRSDSDSDSDSDGMLELEGSVPGMPESFMKFGMGGGGGGGDDDDDDDDGCGVDDFDMFGANMEKTIESLQALRARAQTLPDDQRRELALRVALSFARQVGEDTDEFEGLVDESIALDPEDDAAAKSLFAGLEFANKIDMDAMAAQQQQQNPPPLMSQKQQQQQQQKQRGKKSKKGKKK